MGQSNQPPGGMKSLADFKDVTVKIKMKNISGHIEDRSFRLTAEMQFNEWYQNVWRPWKEAGS
jgi:hypothetical protein